MSKITHIYEKIGRPHTCSVVKGRPTRATSVPRRRLLFLILLSRADQSEFSQKGWRMKRAKERASERVIADTEEEKERGGGMDL